jgi:hypothetical protein
MRYVPLRPRRRGIEMRLVPDDTAPPSRVDRALLKTVASALSQRLDLPALWQTQEEALGLA